MMTRPPRPNLRIVTRPQSRGDRPRAALTIARCFAGAVGAMMILAPTAHAQNFNFADGNGGFTAPGVYTWGYSANDKHWYILNQVEGEKRLLRAAGGRRYRIS